MAKRREKKTAEPVPEIAIVGELFEEGETEIVKSLLDVEPGSEVVLYFDSAGGSVYAALTIAALLRFRRLKTTAYVLGECSSSAILVFAACQRRFVTPRSVFLFHRVKWRSEKDVRSDEAINWADHFQWLEKAVDDYQAALFELPHEQFSEWIQQGRFVGGAELVELGVAEMVDV